MNVYAHGLWMVYLTRGRTWRRWAVLWGVMPDLAYIPLLFAYHVAHGWTRSAHMLAWDWAWQHPLTIVPHTVTGCAVGLAIVRWRRPEWFTAVAVGWGSHVVIDALTHVSDAYPLFWPLSDRRFPSVVSYWEAEYYGRQFFLVNHVLMGLIGALVVASWVVRRRTPRGDVRKVPSLGG